MRTGKCSATGLLCKRRSHSSAWATIVARSLYFGVQPRADLMRSAPAMSEAGSPGAAAGDAHLEVDAGHFFDDVDDFDTEKPLP